MKLKSEKAKDKFFIIDTEYAYIADNEGTVFVNDKGVELSVPSADFVEMLMHGDLGVFPNAVRWVSDGVPPGFAYERHPESRRLKWQGESLLLPLPWAVFFVLPTEAGKNNYTLEVKVRNEQIFSMEDELFVPPLPGLDEDGVLQGFSQPLHKPMAESLEWFINRAFLFMGDCKINENLIPPQWEDENAPLTHWAGLDVGTIVEQFPFKPSATRPSVEMVIDSNTSHLELSFDTFETLLREMVAEKKQMILL